MANMTRFGKLVLVGVAFAPLLIHAGYWLMGIFIGQPM